MFAAFAALTVLTAVVIGGLVAAVSAKQQAEGGSIYAQK